MKKKTPRSKILLYSFFLLVLNLVVLELFSYGVICLTKGKFCDYSVFDEERKAVIVRNTKEGSRRDVPHIGGKNYEVIHPYLGYVHDPFHTEDRSLYGFQDYGPHIDKNPIPTKEANVITIGVFGGSFAGGTAIYAREKVLDAIEQSGLFGRKEVELYNFALPGYKQPQQLMTLSFLLSIGAHFDIVINIDGFNEVALPKPENISKNVYPFFPIKWNMRVAQTLDTELVAIAGKIQALTEKRSSWADFFDRNSMKYSMTCNLAWKLYDRILSKDIAGQTRRLKEFKRSDKDRPAYVASGPGVNFVNDGELYNAFAKVWHDSSLQMGYLCASNGIFYFHFIQPNQYVENSKPMGDEERSIAISDEQPYREGVEKGYSHIQRYGKLLIDEGINLTDLSYIFKDNTETLYGDNCCHLNKKGYEIIAEAIGSAIVNTINDSGLKPKKISALDRHEP